MTDRFVTTAAMISELNGVPDYPVAVIDHPIANNSDALLRKKAEIAAAQIVSFLRQRTV